MAIADVIKQYRNKNGLTQKEMARRLGVTAPAVNKWEKGNTLPDVSLLVPIARLLGITIDELLSFHDELTEEEINQFVLQVKNDLEEKEFAEVFEIVKRKIEDYPNCESLIWQTAMLLHVNRMETKMANAKDYDQVIFGWFERCLLSENEQIRKNGAEALFYAYYGKEDYEKASCYLTYYSTEDPECKRKEALIKSKIGNREDAYRAYEELIFTGYQSLKLNLNNLRLLYMEDDDHDMAKKLVNVSSQTAAAFEMGRYNEVCFELDVAAWEKDKAQTIQILKDIFENIKTIGDFTKSSLYQHMRLKAVPEDFSDNLKKELFGIFEDDSFTYMEGNESWEILKKQIKLNDIW